MEKYAFQHIGPMWKYNSDKTNFFDARLVYAESVPIALMSAARHIFEKVAPKERPTLPDINTSLLDSTTFNCFAKRERSQTDYSCALSTSVILGAMEMACHYFGYEQFFPDIGDVNRGPVVQLDISENPPLFQILEGCIEPRFNPKFDEVAAANLGSSIRSVTRHSQLLSSNNHFMKGTELFSNFDSLLDLMLPKCGVRRMHCIYMVDILVHFLWIHEINHVTNGHLTFLKNRDQVQAVEHFEYTLGQFAGSSSSADIDLLAMEFDADIDAALITIGLILSDIDIEDDDAPYTDKSSRIALFVFTLSAFYCAVATKEAEEFPALSHPPASLRYENILVHLIGAVDAKSEVGAAILDGYWRFYSVYDSFQCNWIPEFFPTNSREELASERWVAINRHRRNISQGYDRFRLGNLKVFLRSLDLGLHSSEFFEIGPDPEWWND